MDRPIPDIHALREKAITECVELFGGERDAAERWLERGVFT